MPSNITNEVLKDLKSAPLIPDSALADNVELVSRSPASPNIVQRFTLAKIKTYLAAKLLPAGGSTGQVLIKADGGDYDVVWATPSSGGATSLAGLSDVNESTGPTNGQTLIWNSTTGKWTPGTISSGAASLAGLSDVNETTAPTDKQVLRYDNASGKWKPSNSGLASDVDVDVTTAAPTDKQVLRYDNASGKWKPSNSALASDVDVDVTTTAPTNGQSLVWNSASSKWKPGTVSGGGSTTLAGLTDVSVTGVGGGQTLVYNTSTGKWTFKSVPTIAPSAVGPVGETVSGGPPAKTYWRVRGSSQSGSNLAASDIQFRTAAGVTVQNTGGTPLADSSFSGMPSSSAFDANINTAWASNASTGYIGYQFPSAVAICEVAISARNDSFFTQSPGSFFLEWSSDGISWTTQFSRTGITWASAGQQQVFTDANAGTAATVTETYPTALAALNDINVTTAPTDGQALVYNAATGKWKPATVASGSGGSSSGGGGGNLIKLIDTTLAADGTTINFGSVSQSYDDLVLIIYPVLAGNAANNTVTVQFNGDTSLSYDYRLWSTFENVQSLNQAGAQIATAGYQATNQGAIEATIFNYATASGEKHIRSTEDVAGGGNFFTRFYNAWWHPTTPAPVTSISVICSTNFKAGSRAVLYGRGGVAGGLGGGGGNGLVLLSTQTVTGAASVIFNNTLITSQYDEYELRWNNVTSSAAGPYIGIQLSPDNGVTWRNSSANYRASLSLWGLTTNFSAYQQLSTTPFMICSRTTPDATIPTTGRASFAGLLNAAVKKTLYSDHLTKASDGNVYRELFGSYYSTAEAINAIQILADSGTISGTFSLYGVSKAAVSSAPWWFQPAAASSFTLLSGDATNLTLLDDAQEGLLIDAGAPAAGDHIRGAFRTLTDKTKDWTLTARMDFPLTNANYSYFGLCMYDSVATKAIGFKLDNSASLDGSRFNGLGSFNSAGSGFFTLAAGSSPCNWFRIARVGANVTYYVSSDGKSWTNIKTESVTAYLTNPPDKVGIFIGYNRASGPNVVGSCPYFSLTGPAV